jgi:hypothetical protein
VLGDPRDDVKEPGRRSAIPEVIKALSRRSANPRKGTLEEE